MYSLLFSGLLPPGTQFDLFRGTAAMKQDEEDMYPTTLGHTIKVNKKLCFDLISFIWKRKNFCVDYFLAVNSIEQNHINLR